MVSKTEVDERSSETLHIVDHKKCGGWQYQGPITTYWQHNWRGDVWKKQQGFRICDKCGECQEFIAFHTSWFSAWEAITLSEMRSAIAKLEKDIADNKVLTEKYRREYREQEEKARQAEELRRKQLIQSRSEALVFLRRHSSG